jgi:hypothetical protein
VDEFLVNYILIPHHRQHVFRDLMAYCCTFEHCDSGLFESRIAWKDHEIAEHRRDWRCPSCQHGFGTRDLVAQHMLAEHPATEDGLLHALVTAASPQHASAKISDCPFCDRHNAKSNLPHRPEPVTVQQDHDSSGFQVSIDVYQRHLSRHMEQLALFAVPPADNDGDDSDAAEDDIVVSDEDSDEDDEEDEDDEDEHVFDSFVPDAVSSPDVQTTSSGTVFPHQRAIDIARNTEGDLDPGLAFYLEKAFTDLSKTLNSYPDSHILSKDEFAVFSYFRHRFQDDLGERAVDRYWRSTYQRDGSPLPELDRTVFARTNDLGVAELESPPPDPRRSTVPRDRDMRYGITPQEVRHNASIDLADSQVLTHIC